MPVMPPTFRPGGQRTAEQRERDNDQRRGSARARGYSTSWDKAAASFKRDHPLCALCDLNGLTVATDVVDHLYPHRQFGGFWDKTRWVPLCEPCHSGEKQATERQGLPALHTLADRLALPRLQGGGGV
jgi:5-methylcytosine-specific restriction protein A